MLRYSHTLAMAGLAGAITTAGCSKSQEEAKHFADVARVGFDQLDAVDKRLLDEGNKESDANPADKLAYVRSRGSKLLAICVDGQAAAKALGKKLEADRQVYSDPQMAKEIKELKVAAEAFGSKGYGKVKTDCTPNVGILETATCVQHCTHEWEALGHQAFKTSVIVRRHGASLPALPRFALRVKKK